jgi:myo-inositol-1(or 4)-monophosphatase
MNRSPEELASIACATAEEAAQLALRSFRGQLRVSKKGRTDLVTEVDLASERFIRQRLSELAPEIPVCAEEEGGERATERVFYVDPLDGTTNYVHGHPFWCVSIGVLEHDEAIAGAVVAPSLGLVWTGFLGGEASRNGAPCRVSDTRDLDDALIATGFPQDRATEPHNNFGSFVRVKRAARGVRRCGSAAIDLCFVGDGTYDGYWERALNAWDLAGGAAVVLAAGGRLTAMDGGRAQLAVGHVVASNGVIHDDLLRLASDG